MFIEKLFSMKCCICLFYMCDLISTCHQSGDRSPCHRHGPHFEDKKIEELSTGMKQKASIAVSLVHDPKVVIFDEPTNGLDIVTARNVTDLLQKLRDEGKLVIISTHIMSEAEKLCDRVGIIIDGKKVTEGTLPELLAETNAEDLEDAFFKLYKEHHKEGR